MSNASKMWLVVGLLFVAGYGTWVAQRATSPGEEQSTPADDSAAPPVRPLTKFTLTDQSGSPFDMRTLDGQVWVGSFFFTNCPGPCWQLNQALSTLQQTTDTGDVKFISMTCDPDNDTPAALAKYAAHFKADPKRWTFLTGDLPVLKQIATSFQVALEKETHSDRAFVVDAQGKVRNIHGFHLSDPAELERLKSLVSRVRREEPTASLPTKVQ